MMYIPTLLFILSLLIFYYFILPVVKYFRDPKGLRKYPNLSFWSGISDLPLVYESHKGTRYKRLLEAHQKHPVLRIGPNSLSYADPDAIKDIYGHGTTCTKDIFYSTLAGSHFHLADVVDKKEHARKRKVLSSAYALKNLETWEYKVADMTHRIIKAFDGQCTNPLPKGHIPPEKDLTIDYRLWSNLFTIAAIANIGLSEDIKFLDQGNDLITSEAMDGTIKKVRFRDCLFATGSATATFVWCYDWYKTLVRASKVLSPTYHKKWKLNKDWDGIVYNRATTRWKRYQDGEKLDDFFSALMADKSNHPHNLEWGEIVAEVSIMMNAGSDTTGIALSNVMLLLLQNPHCLARLREETDGVLEEDEIVAPYDKIKHLPYLRACLDEGLRLFPPVSFALPRRTPPEGTTILSDHVAGNTSVGISAYVVHRNESIFPDPESFRPERWLGDQRKELQPYFVPFSTGARGCIGRNISYLEQTILMASLVHRFEFALPYPGWEPVRHETTNLSSGPMPLKIWRR
ncbi:benzoate 4-monooxygenase cytochrome P450 [Aspergillus sclerotiicarbonarius CBS 121057]|uniref:Benzoate 4-monooxygenase cytochrome P450 n=1 Tax=Aspergillus sclerotiicarbonarius (strain CBS 121057 / IBT 28362) TaxID=1448318 RepID=A0A319E2J8_ASPSB|nr:benzoate 4-monooxygenase cytochrome P450 [Aspergillus sclerotiicarbonarius CBS 121057]